MSVCLHVHFAASNSVILTLPCHTTQPIWNVANGTFMFTLCSRQQCLEPAEPWGPDPTFKPASHLAELSSLAYLPIESSIIDKLFHLPQTTGSKIITAELLSPSRRYFGQPLHSYQSHKQPLAKWSVLLCIIVVLFDHQKCVPEGPFGPVCHPATFLWSFLLIQRCLLSTVWKEVLWSSLEYSLCSRSSKGLLSRKLSMVRKDDLPTFNMNLYKPFIFWTQRATWPDLDATLVLLRRT